MSSIVHFLITLYYCSPSTAEDGGELLKVILSIDSDSLPRDLREYPLEPENKAFLYKLLPSHAKSNMVIVEVDEVFENVDLTGKTVPLSIDQGILIAQAKTIGDLEAKLEKVYNVASSAINGMHPKQVDEQMKKLNAAMQNEE